MYEELVKRLRSAESNYQETLDCLSEAADAIEDLNKQIKNWEEALKNALDFIPCWIPVTERLPEIDEKHHCSKDVLAYLKDGGMCFTALEENIFGQACFECERNPAVEEEMIVTHWMPLPKPPKEESNGV